MHAPIAEPHTTPSPRDHTDTHDVNAVVAYNLRAIRRLRGLTQVQVAERLAVFTGHRLPQASISAMERSVDTERRRLFDAHTLYLLSKVFDVPIVYFFLPPPTWLDRSLAGTEEPTGSLLEASLGGPASLPVVDRRLVEVTRRHADGVATSSTDPADASCVERWRNDLRRVSEVDCNARLREIADLLRTLADLHGVTCDDSPARCRGLAATGRR